MKVSISLPADDVATLDEYARSAGVKSRSAAVQSAIRLLLQTDLEHDHATAWDEWESSGEYAAWEAVAADGLDDAAR